MTTKFSTEVSQFIRAYGVKSDDYYWLPFYFKKIEEGLFEVCTFKDLPTELKHLVEQVEPRNEEGNG